MLGIQLLYHKYCLSQWDKNAVLQKTAKNCYLKKLPYYLKIKDSLPENSIVDMEVGIYATSESIEASVAADKEKAKNENK